MHTIPVTAKHYAKKILCQMRAQPVIGHCCNAPKGPPTVLEGLERHCNTVRRSHMLNFTHTHVTSVGVFR